MTIASVAGAQTTDIALGIEAIARRDVRAADSAFARGARGENVQLRPIALQWRANVAWRLRGDTAAAVRYLTEALALTSFNSQVLLEQARLDMARGRPRESLQNAYQAFLSSADAERRGLAARTFAGLLGERTQFSRPAMQLIRDTLASRVARLPGRTVDAMALMQIGAAMRDMATVTAGLRSYLTLVDPGLHGQIDSVAAAPTLADSLAAARLFQLAAAVQDEKRSDVASYAAFLRNVRRSADSVYRLALAGRARPGDFNRVVVTHGRELWVQLDWHGPVREFYPADLYEELGRRFGTVVSFEKSGAYEELHLAHRLGSRTIAVAGREATIEVLDGVVAGGMDAWLLDETGGRAGWVDRGVIYARRTGFTETPFRAWAALADPQSMPGEVLRIMRDSVGDVARARRDSIGYLPGVAARVFRNGATEILDSLNRVETLSDAERAAAFTSIVHGALVQSSIVLHESRHLADLRAGQASADANAEYRAKLDEVAGALRPRLAMTAILSPNIGDRSTHGQANRRIMANLNGWIRRNGRQIEGYDVTAPALLQLPLLSDAQLRAAFESMRRP